ncbi:unnamed protein product [Phytophthora lilii]|uniref:Unnamed protein product n=1 Tax=Phytophthora lilii TaxID=2077276 RepID=A0A9W6TBC3_9STRA|nr:unnamed protein product [Phytophthora lilii]
MHGCMLIPEAQFHGSPNAAWIVQIDPVWPSDKWNGNTAATVATFKSLMAANNFQDLKTLMSNSVYGADCGFTNPNGRPEPIPTDGKATFSRAVVHVGPCEIWLDDKKVLYEDDCYSTYGNPNQDIKSVFPVDYSSCANGGCKEMRFYWLAFQDLSGKTVWQSYSKFFGSGGSSTPTAAQMTASTPQSSQSPPDTPSNQGAPNPQSPQTPPSNQEKPKDHPDKARPAGT